MYKLYIYTYSLKQRYISLLSAWFSGDTKASAKTAFSSSVMFDSWSSTASSPSYTLQDKIVSTRLAT